MQTTIDGRPVIVDTLGRPGGSQGFPGFRPANESSESCNNIGAFYFAKLHFKF